MVANPMTLYVARIGDYCEKARRKAEALGLDLHADRFVAANSYFGKDYGRYKVLVDDIECIISSYPKLGYKLASVASVITTSE